MDMSFARRNRQQGASLAASPELTRLFAQVAARQALSPTACAEAKRPASEPRVPPRRGVDLLGGGRRTSASTISASFNPDIARSVQTLGKSL